MAMPEGRKMIVWHEFKYTAKMIESLLDDMRIKYASIRGGKDNVEAIKRFKYGDARILVANYKSGAAGGNFQVANYAVFFELTDDPIQHRQAFKRTYRTGQTRRTFAYHFVTNCPASVEEKIREFQAQGKSLFEAIVEGKAKIS